MGLVWYSFGLERLDGKGRKMFGPYQLTVYDGGEVVPEWFGEGTTYQIFPDRFCRSGDGNLWGKEGAVIHSNWYDKPYYCKREASATSSITTSSAAISKEFRKNCLISKN